MFIGHPNNPKGAIYTLNELTKLAEEADRSGTYIVIDEGFIDFSN